MNIKIYIVMFSFLCLLIPNINLNSFAQSICVSEDPDDWDGDMIPNEWETKGIDINNDKQIDYGFASFGPSALHKDLFLEIDNMEKHDLFEGVLEDVKNSFAKSPVCNPDGIDGINLHIQYEEEVPHQSVIHIDSFVGSDFKRTWKGFDELKSKYFGTEEERKDSPNINNTLLAKSKVFHYVIVAHAFGYPSNPTSGISRGEPAMDFIISLGNWQAGGATAVGEYNGAKMHQSGTLMHELGHNLGLGHGGGDNVNCKPNYLSIMNYIRQVPLHLPDFYYKLDYSRIELNPLNESDLNEGQGVSTQIPFPVNEVLVWGPIGAQFGFIDKPIDWNYDMQFNSHAEADVNLFPLIGACSKSTPGQILKSHNDWNNLIYITQESETPLSGESLSGLESPALEDELSYADIQNSLAGKLAEYHDKTQILLLEDSVLQSNNVSDTDEQAEMAPESITPGSSIMVEEEDLNELAIGLPSSVSSFHSNLDEESRALIEDLRSSSLHLNSSIQITY